MNLTVGGPNFCLPTSTLVEAASRVGESNGNVGKEDRFADTGGAGVTVVRSAAGVGRGGRKDAYLPSPIVHTGGADVPLTLPRGTLESISAERVLPLGIGV